MGGWAPREGSQSDGGECAPSQRSGALASAPEPAPNDCLPRRDEMGTSSSPTADEADSSSLCEEPDEDEEPLLRKSIISDEPSAFPEEDDAESSSEESESDELLLLLRDRRDCGLELLRFNNGLASRTNTNDWSTIDGNGSLALQFATFINVNFKVQYYTHTRTE